VRRLRMRQPHRTLWALRSAVGARGERIMIGTIVGVLMAVAIVGVIAWRIVVQQKSKSTQQAAFSQDPAQVKGYDPKSGSGSGK
jgi:H+/gluconate symporter-like permease